MRFATAIALLALAAPLQAQAPGVTIESAVFVEHESGAMRMLEPAADFRKGERVVTVLRWEAPRGSYTVTSPVPRTLQFERASADAVEVSIDGGRTWRDLADATPEAVTHIRWRVGTGPGHLSYSAIVR